MEGGTILALTLGSLIVFFPVAFIWYLNIGGMYRTIKRAKAAKLLKTAPQNLSCSIDTDCPHGYVCVSGRCVPQKA